MAKKNQRVRVSYVASDGSHGVEVLKTRRASVQLFPDRRLLVIDGKNSWTYAEV